MNDQQVLRLPTIHLAADQDESFLRARASSLFDVISNSHIGLWCWPLLQNRLYLSAVAQALLGITAQTSAQTQIDYLTLVHANDHERLTHAFSQLLQGLALAEPCYHRIVRSDGQTLWLELSGERQTLANGEQQLLGLLRESRSASTLALPQQANAHGFQHLFQATPGALLLLDLNSASIVDINASFEQLFGWPTAQVRGRTGKQIGLWSSDQQASELLVKMFSQPRLLNEPVQLRNNQGQPMDGLLAWQQLQLDGQSCLLASFTDTRAQVAIQSALRNSQERFAKAFRSSPDSMTITDLESARFLEVNPNFERQFGYTAQQVIGRSSLDLGLWANREQRLALLALAQQHSHIEAFAADLRDCHGVLSHNLIYGDRITLNGQHALVLSIRDISQQLLQERALQDSQERLKLALEGAELGLWDWSLPSNQVFASTHAAQLHGLGSHAHSGPITDFFKFTSAADQQNALQAFKKLRDGITNNFRVIYTVKQPGCVARHLESTAKLYRNSQGQPERMIGVINDISVRTLREQALSASEAKFTTLFHASPEPVSVSRLSDGAFLEVNPSFCQTFGWSAEQVIGKTALQINFWNDLELRLRLGKKLLENGQIDEEIAEFRTQDGRVITCMFAGRLIFIGRRRCLLTTFRDITEQQQVQRALKLSEEKFAKAFFATPDSISISERSSGRFIEVNAGFSDLTGYSAAEAIGRTSLQLNCWGNVLERDQLLAMLARDGQVNNFEIEGRRRNGQLMTTEVSVAGININEVDCLLMIARDISALKQAQAQIQHMAYHDPLTNLPNRALLMDRLSQQIALLKRHNLRGALLFLDLDHFKHINDSLGHPLGDAVLKMIAARLEISIRQEDTVARLGGDEFVVLISGLEGSRTDVGRQVRELANKLRRLMSEPMMLDGHRLQVTPSIGMVLIPDHGDRPDDLLKRADIALYRAKASGRNTLQMFRKNMQEAASARLRLENELRLALARGEFELYLQPQVDARNGQIIGAEALLRWNHPQRGPQSPFHFIEVLEESGLIVEVGDWVLSEACYLCAQLLDEGLISLDRFSLCVNISPRQFRQAGFVEHVANCLQSSNLTKTMLTLEITEGIVIQNIDDTIAKMLQLKKLGLSFAMDDFGTGYSSLTYLKRLPVDILKIDQSFIRDATQNPSDAEIIRAIVAMALSLGLDVIAEGVEHEAQLALLQQQDCHLYQGYLYSQPLPLPAFRALLAHARQRPALN